MTGDEFDLSAVPIMCDGCEDPSATYRVKTGTFWCDLCVRQLTWLHIEV